MRNWLPCILNDTMKSEWISWKRFELQHVDLLLAAYFLSGMVVGLVILVVLSYFPGSYPQVQNSFAKASMTLKKRRLLFLSGVFITTLPPF